MNSILTIVVFLMLFSTSACIAVGYSNRGGWFVWPGGLGLLVLLIILVALMRRRR